MNILRANAVLLLISLLATVANAAPQKLKLWDGPAPGAPANAPPEKDLPQGRVSHVSIPTLDVYHPLKPNGTVLLFCSGGGYKKLASGPLGLGAADIFLKDGYTVCSLKYRLSPPSEDVVRDACMDGARAIRLIRNHAKEWGINPNQIVMIGFSAGANMALNLTCQDTQANPGAKDPLDRLSARPDALVLASLWLNTQQQPSDWALRKDIPPTLFLHAKDDRTALVRGAEDMAQALKTKGVPVELVLYERGGHMAFNLPSPSAGDWPIRFKTWLEQAGR